MTEGEARSMLVELGAGGTRTLTIEHRRALKEAVEVFDGVVNQRDTLLDQEEDEGPGLITVLADIRDEIRRVADDVERQPS